MEKLLQSTSERPFIKDNNNKIGHVHSLWRCSTIEHFASRLSENHFAALNGQSDVSGFCYHIQISEVAVASSNSLERAGFASKINVNPDSQQIAQFQFP